MLQSKANAYQKGCGACRKHGEVKAENSQNE